MNDLILNAGMYNDSRTMQKYHINYAKKESWGQTL